MKKLLLPLLLVISITTVYVSCTNEQVSQEPKVSVQKEIIPITSYGSFHNEGLSLYYKNHQGVGDKDALVVLDEMTADLKAKYPEEFKNVNVSDIKLAFKDVDPKTYDIFSFWDAQKGGLYSTNKVSRKIGVFVDDILRTDLKYDQYIAKIEDFKKNNSLTEDELNKLVIFESVLTSSNQYWTSKSKLTGKTNNPGSKVIVADGLGALMFAYSGPGAIISGMLSSLFVNEALPPYAVPVDPEFPEGPITVEP
jgi:hypothetical protein